MTSTHVSSAYRTIVNENIKRSADQMLHSGVKAELGDRGQWDSGLYPASLAAKPLPTVGFFRSRCMNVCE